MGERSHRRARVGDTFAVPLDDGRFCAVRIIRRCEEEDSSLVALTPWLRGLPKPDDPLLRDVLREHRGFYRGEPAIMWHEGKVPPEFVYIGVILPSAMEQAYDPHGASGGPWGRTMVRPVILELESLDQCDAICPHKVPESQPGMDRVHGVISDAQFWMIIERLDWKDGNDQGIVEPVVAHLCSLSAEKIAGFHARLCEMLFALDREDLAREIGEASYGSRNFSPDHFLDVRCVVVANGRGFFEEVLSYPKKMPKGMEFEALLTVAESAYRRKTGRNAIFVAQHACATFSNTSGWTLT